MISNSKVILITGASSGIGKASANYLAEQGNIVFGTSRFPGSYPNPENFKMLQMDITDNPTIEAAVEQIVREQGRIDVLINNAGFGIAGAAEDTSIVKGKEQFDTLFFGAVRLINKVLPLFRNQNSGLIINISSIGGLIGLPYQAYYSAAKFAIEGYTEALYKELRPTNIKTVLIEPGDFNTEFTSKRQIIRKSKQSDSFSKTLKVIEDDEQNGKDPIKIAQLIHKIIENKKPKLRYIVGSFHQKLAAFLKRILPNRLFDWIIMKHYRVI